MSQSKQLSPGVIDYSGQMAANYQRGRTLSSEAVATWTAIVAPFVQHDEDFRILDLGAGTGDLRRFSRERSRLRLPESSPQRPCSTPPLVARNRRTSHIWPAPPNAFRCETRAAIACGYRKCGITFGTIGPAGVNFGALSSLIAAVFS